MKHTLSIVLALAVSAPAFAAPGQISKQNPPQQTREGTYWLSRDMQKLVFWQPPERAPRTHDLGR